MMKPKLFLCPNCERSIPQILQICVNINEAITVKFNCTCNVSPSWTFSLKDSLSSVIKQDNCRLHYEMKRNCYCIDCKGWLCLDCQYSHSQYFFNHELISSVFYQKKKCIKHCLPLSDYCSSCRIDCCIKCLDEHSDHHTFSLENYWRRVKASLNNELIEQLILQAKQKTYERQISSSSLHEAHESLFSKFISVIYYLFTVQSHNNYNHSIIRNCALLKFNSQSKLFIDQVMTNKIPSEKRPTTLLATKAYQYINTRLVNNNHQSISQLPIEKYNKRSIVNRYFYTNRHSLYSDKNEEIYSVIEARIDTIALVYFAEDQEEYQIKVYDSLKKTSSTAQRITKSKLYSLSRGNFISYSTENSNNMFRLASGLYLWNLWSNFISPFETLLFKGLYDNVIQMKPNRLCASQNRKTILIMNYITKTIDEKLEYPEVFTSFLQISPMKVAIGFDYVIKVEFCRGQGEDQSLSPTSKTKMKFIMKFINDALASYDEDHLITVWNRINGRIDYVIGTEYPGLVKLLVINDRQFATISNTHNVSIQNVDNFQCNTVIVEDKNIKDIQVYSEGKLVVVQSNEVGFWN